MAQIETNGAYTFFRTGTQQPLLTLELPFDVPESNNVAALSFEFGFATAEPNLPGTFFDSFSMTLQASNSSATALLFTADRSGTAWAPFTPGTLSLSPEQVAHQEVTSPVLPSDLTVRFAYAVSLVLPGPLSGGALSVFLDLFDNLNGVASLGYIKGLRLDATGSVNTKARFYRLRSALRTRLDEIEDLGPNVLLHFHFVPRTLELQVAPAVEGPYARDTNAVISAVAQQFIVPQPGTNRYFRILSERPAHLVATRVEGGQLQIEYDFDQVDVFVESALSPRSSFQEEHVTRRETPARKIRVPKPGQTLTP